MNGRKLDVSTGAGGMVTVRRNVFDSHLSSCPDCEMNLCTRAQSLWRNVCVEALKAKNQAAV